MRNTSYGIIAVTLAALFFATFSALNRIVPQNVGTFHQLLIRTFLMGSIFLIAGLVRKDFSKLRIKNIPLTLLRGLFVVGDFATFFIAVSHLQLGVMLFLFYASIIITSYVYGSLILHEKVSKIKLISLLLAFGGLGIMYINNFHAFTSLYVLLALFSGFSYGLNVASSKSLEKYSVNQVNAFTFLSAGFLSIPLLLLSHEPTTITSFSTIPWLPFLIWSATGVVAFYLIILGFKFLEAQKASLLSLSEILFAIVIGFLVYKEIPTPQALIGGICIVLALALPNITISKKAR